MATSVEHHFVTETFLELVVELSASTLYGYKEADRGQFDFACLLDRDRSRHVNGQTLKGHADGIEKDLNTLLHADEDQIAIYLTSATTRNERRIHEVVERARKVIPDRVALLRLIRYPANFNADNEDERRFIKKYLREQVLSDLLLNVVFGRISRHDVTYAVNCSEVGRDIAVLHAISSRGFQGFLQDADLMTRLREQDRRYRSMGLKDLRRTLSDLSAAGMLSRAINTEFYRPTQRGRVFLAICSILAGTADITKELAFILDRLGLGSGTDRFEGEGPRVTSRHTPQNRREYLIFNLMKARDDLGVKPSSSYPTTDFEIEPEFLRHLEFIER